jgi:glycosyltransferase involved in cell wall biosynthesis
MRDSRLKVLHVLNELKPSGAETMLKVAAKKFRAKGIESHILETGTQSGSFGAELARAGYRIHHIPFGRSVLFFLRLFVFLRREHFDLAHFHAEGANFWSAMTARLTGQRRLVRTVHNCFEFDGSLRQRRAVQRNLLSRLGVRYVSISPSVAENELRRYGIETTLIPNWYDSEHFRPPSVSERISARRQFGYADQDVVIVSVGNCNRTKNHGAVLEAMTLFPKWSRIKYLHVGMEELGHPERELATALGVSPNIQFAGPLNDVREALWAADIYVMSSLHEGFSIAALEAISVGLPAVLYDSPGLRDLKEPFPDLTLVKNPKNLSAALLATTESTRQRRNEITGKNHEIARRRFGVDAGVESYCRLYQSLV